MSVEDLALEHYRRQQAIARQTAGRLTALWDFLGPMGFRDQAGDAAQVVAAGQYAAAAQSQAYLEAAAVDAGVSTSAAANPRAFSGLSTAGNALDVVLSLPTGRMFGQIDAGRDSSEAYQAARARVALIGRNEATQAGTNALGVSLAGNRRTFPKYVRMLTRPSCRRCVILAGARYYSHEAFNRHPGCDCVHVPVTEETLHDVTIRSPESYFESLTEAEQDRVFGKKHAQAIRDGADIIKVVNRAEKGAGILSRSVDSLGRRVRTRRMTVDEIYRAAGGDRDRLVALFTEQGYLGTSGLKPLGSAVRALKPPTLDVDAVLARAQVGRDFRLSRGMSSDTRAMLRAELADYDTREAAARAAIEARLKELKDVYGVRGRDLANYRAGRKVKGFADSVIANERYRLEQIAEGRERLGARLADYGTDLASLAKDVPGFDPENPLAFYGDVLQIVDDGPTVARSLADLEALPREVHEALRDYYLTASNRGAGLYVSERARSIVELDDLGDLRGVRPRGYTEGASWDVSDWKGRGVGGVHSGTRRVTAVAHGGNDGSVSVALHEVMHAYDSAAGRPSEFDDLWRAVQVRTSKIVPYFHPSGNPEGWLSEAWAEGAATFFKGRGRSLAERRALWSGMGSLSDEDVEALTDYFERRFR